MIWLDKLKLFGNIGLTENTNMKLQDMNVSYEARKCRTWNRKTLNCRTKNMSYENRLHCNAACIFWKTMYEHKSEQQS